MLLTKFHIMNFRSLQNIEWSPGRLNVLIGPNAGGKSNLLAALQLLQAASTGGLQQFVLSRGGITSLIFDATYESGVTSDLSAVFGVQCESRVGDKQNDVEYGYFLDMGNMYTFGNAFIREERLTAKPLWDIDASTSPIQLLFRQYDRAGYWSFPANKWLDIAKDRLTDETMMFQICAHALQESFPAYRFQAFLASWVVLQHFNTTLSAPIRNPATTSYDPVLQADGSNLITFLHTHCSQNREFKQALETAMKAAFGEEFEELIFAPAADQRIQLRIRWKSLNSPRSSVDLSDGTLRFLFIASTILNPNPPGIIAIDEPETGLHPRMLPIIAELAAEASERTQVVFATHSPDLLEAFPMDAVPTITVVETVEGSTKLSNLNTDDLARWLKEYTLGEMFRSGTLESMT